MTIDEEIRILIILNKMMLTALVLFLCIEFYQYINLEKGSPAYDAFMEALFNKFLGSMFGFGATTYYANRLYYNGK